MKTAAPSSPAASQTAPPADLPILTPSEVVSRGNTRPKGGCRGAPSSAGSFLASSSPVRMFPSWSLPPSCTHRAGLNKVIAPTLAALRLCQNNMQGVIHDGFRFVLTPNTQFQQMLRGDPRAHCIRHAQ